ncbi:MAG: hypothetical protein AAF991_13630, partial [Pseudomonadota bacterium]
MTHFRLPIPFLAFCFCSFQALADARLAALMQGGDLTPALSGLQVSLMERGRLEESFAFGFAQLRDDGAVPLRTDHKVRVASISKLVVAIGVM